MTGRTYPDGPCLLTWKDASGVAHEEAFVTWAKAVAYARELRGDDLELHVPKQRALDAWLETVADARTRPPSDFVLTIRGVKYPL